MKSMLGRALSNVLAIVSALSLVACSPTAQAPTSGASPVGTSSSGSWPSASLRPSPSATNATAPAEETDPGQGHEWARLPANPAFSSAQVFGLAEGGASLIASGMVVLTQARRIEGAIWASDDGRTWQRVAGGRGFENAAVASIAKAPDGTLLATGANCYFESECLGPRLWRSNDGLSWTPIESNLFSGMIPSELIPGEPGWIVIGSSSKLDAAPLLWTSVDGQSWAPASGLDREPGHVAGVVVTGSGLVAYGSSHARGQSTAAVWTSDDGSQWTRVPADSAPRGLATTALGIVDGLLIAFVRDETGAELWTSENGLTWEHRQGASPSSVIDGRRPVRIENLIKGGPGLIAFGSADVLPGTEPIGVWVSADGVTWRAAKDSDAFAGAEGVAAAIRHGSQILVVGARSCPTDCPGKTLFWISPAP